MSGFAMLQHSEAGAPRVVQLAVSDDALVLSGANGFAEQVPWWRLYRFGEGGSVHRFRRIDRQRWELRVNAGADQALLAHVARRSIVRLLAPLQRLHLVKVLAALVTAVFALSSAIPVRSVAGLIPAAGERRLVEGYVASRAPDRCAWPGAEAALRKLMTLLDPELGPRVDIVALNDGEPVVTAVPAGKLMLTRGAVAEIEADALAGLIAHELAHIRRGDPIAATVRHEGTAGIFLALLEGPDREHLFLRFSGQEEEAADREAIAMMRRAGIAIAPSAALFEAMRMSRLQQTGFAYTQRDLHFGIADRVQFWRLAAAQDMPKPGFPLNNDETDALYNFCWAGPIPGLAGQRAAAGPPPRPAFGPTPP